MNLFIFNGTICKDIEMKYTQNCKDIEMKYTQNSGMSVISSSLAFNKKDANGNQSTVFLDFVAFGKTAELINQYYQKGDMLCGTGEIAMDEWQDKDTKARRTKHKIMIQKLEFTKSPKAWASGANSTHNGANEANNGAKSNVNYNQQPPKTYGNYDTMPAEVQRAVDKHNASYNQAPQGVISEDEIPF